MPDDSLQPVISGQPAGTSTPAEPAEPVQRMRVFSGDLELVVASVEQSRERIILAVESAGGYVESSSADYLVVRVPAERFDSTLEQIEEEGDVRSRSVRTADVTDQFLDLERRLQIAVASRDRLLTLLERTEDPDERVAILRDIRRLTEEIEQLRSSLESLSQLVRYSRITVRLISRIQVSQVARSRIPFRWIANLAPLQVTTRPAAEEIPVSLGDSFAVFEEGVWVRAEAADGTVVRAGAVSNNPAGSTEFWQSALLYHLAPFFRTARPEQAGEYRGVLFESRDTNPFYYLVLVQPVDEELIVAEAFFPTAEARDAHLSGVRDAFAEGAP
jgi:hypothetical protein